MKIILIAAAMVLISASVYICAANSKLREAQYIKIKPNIPPMPPTKQLAGTKATWKFGDWVQLQNKVEDIMLIDNGEMITKGYAAKNVSEETKAFYTKFHNSPCNITLEDIYNFAEEYGVSIDYLLGRSDKEML